LALDTSGYQDFRASVDGIENPLALDIRVDPASNDGANVCCIYTGTAKVGPLQFVQGKGLSSGQWSRGYVEIDLPTPGRRWTFIPECGIPDGEYTHTFYCGGTVVVSLASIFNKNVANNAGWAVDGADLVPLGYEVDGLRIEAQLALRDSDGFLYRISYQATALGLLRTRDGFVDPGGILAQP
jgi:hypothetical protein